MLEVLDCTLVLFSFFSSIERPEIFAFAGLGIFLSRVEPVLPRLQFSDHGVLRRFIRPQFLVRDQCQTATFIPIGGPGRLD
jgi:hypothetical protein